MNQMLFSTMSHQWGVGSLIQQLMYLYLFSYIQDKGYEPDAVLNYVTSVGSGFTDSTADVFVFVFLYSG